MKQAQITTKLIAIAGVFILGAIFLMIHEDNRPIGTEGGCQYTTPAKIILTDGTQLKCEGFDNGPSCSNLFENCIVEINNSDYSKCEWYFDITNNIECVSDNNECGRCMVWEEHVGSSVYIPVEGRSKDTDEEIDEFMGRMVERTAYIDEDGLMKLTPALKDPIEINITIYTDDVNIQAIDRLSSEEIGKITSYEYGSINGNKCPIEEILFRKFDGGRYQMCVRERWEVIEHTTEGLPLVLRKFSDYSNCKPKIYTIRVCDQKEDCYTNGDII